MRDGVSLHLDTEAIARQAMIDDERRGAIRSIPAKYASPDPSTLSKLPKPTRKDAERGKCNECGGFHGLPAIHLDYMGHADVTLALLDVDPLWSWEPAAIDEHTGGPAIQQQGNRLVMWARLTIHGKSMLGVGTCESGKGDPEKELIGDFLRNAAMRFGIATNLWSKSPSADPFGTDAGGGYERQRPARQQQRNTGGNARGRQQQPTSADAPPAGDPNRGTVTTPQIKAMAAGFNGIGIRDRDARIDFIRQIVDRQVGSSTELSKEEVGKVLDAIDSRASQQPPADPPAEGTSPS